MLKQQVDANRQRTQDREERTRARVQRFDEQFQQTAANLSSTNNENRAAAAATIATFMRPEYREFHERLFLLLLGVLRFPRHNFSDKLLVRTLQRIATGQIPPARAESPALPLDLSNCWLARIELKGLNLSEADIAFAKLNGADLTSSVLWRVRGYEANLRDAQMNGCNLEEARLNRSALGGASFADANLISAKLKEVDASGTVFRGARMQEVHLEDATLFGTHFEGADLNNAYFRGALFDGATLRSIALHARHWREANWDEEVRLTLIEISASP